MAPHPQRSQRPGGAVPLLYTGGRVAQADEAEESGDEAEESGVGGA
jgi:hypothetical protein